MRTITPTTMQDIQSSSVQGVYLFLLTLSHSTWAQDIRVVNNREALVSNNVTYHPAGFEIKLASLNGDQTPRVMLSVDNVDRLLIDEIRATPTPISVSLKLVSHDRPNIVEIDMPDMTLRDVSYTATVVQGALVIDEILNLRFPKGKVTSTNYAGLY